VSAPAPAAPPPHGLPGFKATPKADQAKARAERARRKACHGTWQACDTAHPEAPA